MGCNARAQQEVRRRVESVQTAEPEHLVLFAGHCIRSQSFGRALGERLASSLTPILGGFESCTTDWLSHKRNKRFQIALVLAAVSTIEKAGWDVGAADIL